MTRITLAEAIETGQLERFIQQAEADGIGPIERGQLDATIARVVTPKRSVDRTSRSSSRGGSTGKRTR
jgi:hypothetical protein